MKIALRIIKWIFVINIIISLVYWFFIHLNTVSLKDICNDSLLQKTDNQLLTDLNNEKFELGDKFNIVNNNYTRFLMNASRISFPAVCILKFENNKVVDVLFSPSS